MMLYGLVTIYDISSYTNSKNSSIVFLIGWTIKNVNDFCYVEGNVYKRVYMI